VTLSTGNVITVGEGSCPAIAQSSGCDGEERAGECEALFCGLGGVGGRIREILVRAAAVTMISITATLVSEYPARYMRGYKCRRAKAIG
jgi:hypothetical protein